MFVRGRSTLNIDVKTLMMVDSLEMTDDDRDIIINNCKRSKSKDILITHGTDTIVSDGCVVIYYLPKCIYVGLQGTTDLLLQPRDVLSLHVWL